MSSDSEAPNFLKKSAEETENPDDYSVARKISEKLNGHQISEEEEAITPPESGVGKEKWRWRSFRARTGRRCVVRRRALLTPMPATRPSRTAAIPPTSGRATASGGTTISTRSAPPTSATRTTIWPSGVRAASGSPPSTWATPGSAAATAPSRPPCGTTRPTASAHPSRAASVPPVPFPPTEACLRIWCFTLARTGLSFILQIFSQFPFLQLFHNFFHFSGAVFRTNQKRVVRQNYNQVG